MTGFNTLLRRGQRVCAATEILDQDTADRVFTVQPNLDAGALNTEFVTSAALTSTNPQTVVYQINPEGGVV